MLEVLSFLSGTSPEVGEAWVVLRVGRAARLPGEAVGAGQRGGAVLSEQRRTRDQPIRRYLGPKFDMAVPLTRCL